MKISKETVSVMKTMSTINTNLLIKKGSRLSTVSPQKNIVAEIDVPEVFPSDFGIYDTTEWLGVLSLFNDADVDFSAKFATITDGDSSVQYYAADESILVVPSKPITFPKSDVDFELPAATLAMALKTAGVLRSGDISIRGDGKNIKIVIADLKNATSNSFNMVVGKTTETFTANLKTENLKLVPGDYSVSLSSKKISRFKHATMPATFFIALETSSSF